MGTMHRLVRLVALVLCLLLPLLASAGQSPRMHRFLPADGLPSRQVLQLAQDSRGYVWAATADGLARLDGTGIRVWRHDPSDPASLPLNYIESLAIDDQDRVWVGTNGLGVVRLRRDGSGFERFEEVNKTCGFQVWSMAWMDDQLWLGGNRSGLCLVDRLGNIQRITAGTQPGQLPNGQIYALRADPRGRMWIGTGAGLFRWEGGQLYPVAAAQLSDVVITRISLDRDGRLWVSSNEHLWQLRVSDEQLTEVTVNGQPLASTGVLQERDGTVWLGSVAGLYLQRQGEPQLLTGGAVSGFWNASSTVLDMLQDHEGGLWFATYSQGLAYLQPDWQRFSSVYHHRDQLLESMLLTHSAADGDGFLITSDQGLFRLDAAGELKQLVTRAQAGGAALWSVQPLPDGQIVVGTRGRMLWFDRQGQRLRSVPVVDGSNPYERVDLITLMPDGTLWTKVIGVGLQQRTADGRLLRTLQAGGVEGLPDEQVHQLRAGPDGVLWVASEAGLHRWDGERLHAVRGLASAHGVHDIVFAYHNLLWVAGDGVLAQYRWQDNTVDLVEQAGPPEGVPAVSLGGLLLSDGGQLWATSPRGLVRWSGRGEVMVYGAGQGVPEMEFIDRPPSRNARRGLALSRGGLVHFDMDQAQLTLPTSQLLVSAVAVRQRKGHQFLPRAMDDNLLVLQPDDGEALVTARLISHAGRGSQRYRFKLEGVDHDWVEVGADGQRTLSHLPGGTHQLRVQARWGQSDWVSGPGLTIQVKPYWWATPWARGLWVLCAVLALALMAWQLRRRVQHKQRWQLLNQRRDLAEQASRDKTHFLSALGHEVRTPLTGVLGMSELLLDTALDNRQRGWAGAIHTAGSHLLRLLDDALDMAGIEAGRLQLNVQPFSLAALLREVCGQIEPQVQGKGLSLRRPDELPGQVRLHGDAVRLRQILLNLMANALRHTREGHIGLQCRLDPLGRGLQLQVDDTGPALSDENQQRLFERFDGQDNATVRVAGGGVGLAISRELVKAMGGTIAISSQREGGNSIVVDLPLRWELDLGQGAAEAGASGAEAGTALRVLLVEDDHTVAEVICALLRARGHTVSHVVNGLQALTLVATEAFDVGLFDLDLPGIGGLALARQLRSMGQQMPLLAVTARSDAQAEGEVQSAGFDAYVRKPVTGVLLAEALVGMVRAKQVATAGDSE